MRGAIATPRDMEALRAFEAASGAGAGAGGGGGGGGGAGEGLGGLGYDPVVRPGVVLERRPPLARTYFAHNRAMRAYVGTLRVRDKRKLFSSLRAPDIDTDVYIPPYGFVAGVFATNYLLGDGQRKKNGSSTFSLRREGEAP